MLLQHPLPVREPPMVPLSQRAQLSPVLLVQRLVLGSLESLGSTSRGQQELEPPASPRQPRSCLTLSSHPLAPGLLPDRALPRVCEIRMSG
jgi:hypothetical protein